MMGLAASGKSTFASALERSGEWVRANQDEKGRKGYEDIVALTVPKVRQCKQRLVVDRCNLTCDERKELLGKLGRPPPIEVLCVFFDSLQRTARNAPRCERTT